MNRVVVEVLTVLALSAVMAGGGVARASEANVLPPVPVAPSPVSAASPSTAMRPQAPAGAAAAMPNSPPKPTNLSVNAVAKPAASPVQPAVATAPIKSPAAPQSATVNPPPVAAFPKVSTASVANAPVPALPTAPPVASAVPVWSPDLPPHTAAKAVASEPAVASAPAMARPTTPPVPAKSEPEDRAGAVPVWSPDLPAHAAAKAVVSGPAVATAPAMARPITPPVPAKSEPEDHAGAVPVWSPDLPAHAAAKASAPPTALAAILPPSAAHTDYPRLNGVTDGEREYREDGFALADSPSHWIVRIFKHSHRLEVYYRDNLYKSYHAVFGRSEYPGRKEIENDRRTPEGDYMIVGKHPSRRFEWFLKINYPNADDQQHFTELREEGEIPRWAREGGQVGIHGTDNPLLNVGDVNWTTGCISIDNQDIDELARLLPIGTVVIIKP